MAATPLDPAVVEQIYARGGSGRAAWKAGDLAAAEADFLAAWALLPEPRPSQDYAQSMSGALVTFFRDTKQIDKARHWLGVMRQAYGPEDGTGYVDFVAATVDYEAGDLDSAYKIFHEQYKRFKKRPFEGKDPKYLAFYRQRAAGG